MCFENINESLDRNMHYILAVCSIYMYIGAVVDAISSSINTLVLAAESEAPPPVVLLFMIFSLAIIAVKTIIICVFLLASARLFNRIEQMAKTA